MFRYSSKLLILLLEGLDLAVGIAKRFIERFKQVRSPGESKHGKRLSHAIRASGWVAVFMAEAAFLHNKKATLQYAISLF